MTSCVELAKFQAKGGLLLNVLEQNTKEDINGKTPCATIFTDTFQILWSVSMSQIRRINHLYAILG